MATPTENTWKNSKLYFFFIIGLPVIFWAFAFPFIKIGLEELSPINLTIIRLFFVCSVFLVLFCSKRKHFSKLHKKDIPSIFLLGFVGVVVYHLGLNYGEQYISPSAASLIIATIPLFVVLLAAVYLHEPLTWKITFGILLSLFGVVIISTIGKPDATIEITYLSGAFGVLVAALVGAGYTIAGKKILERYTALSLTVYAFLFGSLGLLPFLSSSLIREILSLSPKGWFAVVFLALFSTVISYVFWFVALELKSASEVSIYLYFIPVLSTCLSYLLFQEQITWFFLSGGALVILGLFIVNTQKKVTRIR
jgi:drug/metabolite transporter (DMT)-like permease